ncbi:HSP20 family protein [Enhydrobacter aerosaccus]|uniref:HSP20 family protein n=1 Tax=Enhydrobacter aerosaccus TaxID=225324 RepID=A0A1T4R8W7_9HYPH|nr:Hsp20/alpha crystallin family protein [Enhydrobacter aerosaccus]SKA12379.1 HSP20 family protein [Enhydrobacter aerosaccus]
MANQVPKPVQPPSAPSFPWLGMDIDQYFNRLLRSSWPFKWPETGMTEAPRALRAFEHMPQVEVKENDKHYTVMVELPGLDEKDVKATVEGDVLTISGEKKVERTDEKTHYSERSYGSFTRSFTLPNDADRNNVAAHFVKGVLTVEIPKTANAPQQGKQIEIKAS